MPCGVQFHAGGIVSYSSTVEVVLLYFCVHGLSRCNLGFFQLKTPEIGRCPVR